MHILIVDRDVTETSYQDDLRAIWTGHAVETIGLADFTADSLADRDIVVVAGAGDSDSEVPLEPLSALTNVMLDPELSVLAIGWGFEVACLAYGDDLPEIADRVEGAIRMVPTGKGEALFQGSDPLRITATIRWSIDELPRGLIALARSETGIEAFAHKVKPLQAIQQLPQDFTYESDAKLVYQNLLNLRSKRG